MVLERKAKGKVEMIENLTSCPGAALFILSRAQDFSSPKKFALSVRLAMKSHSAGVAQSVTADFQIQRHKQLSRQRQRFPSTFSILLTKFDSRATRTPNAKAMILQPPSPKPYR